METTRRGFFGLVAGMFGAALAASACGPLQVSPAALVRDVGTSLGGIGRSGVGFESPRSDQRGNSSEERQNPLRPRGRSKRRALLRFAIGCTLFSLGLLRAYRLDVNCKRSQLIYPFLLTLGGSIILLVFRWPR